MLIHQDLRGAEDFGVFDHLGVTIQIAPSVTHQVDGLRDIQPKNRMPVPASCPAASSDQSRATIKSAGGKFVIAGRVWDSARSPIAAPPNSSAKANPLFAVMTTPLLAELQAPMVQIRHNEGEAMFSHFLTSIQGKERREHMPSKARQ
jgi:hypothetical protein